MSGERTRVEAKSQGNAGECRGIPRNARGTCESGGKASGECRGMQGNTVKCQGNVWEWVQSARGMLGIQGDAKGTYGSGCKLPGECRECR